MSPNFTSFYSPHQKSGKVSPKNHIFHTFCIFMSYENKKNTLDEFLINSHRYEVSECMVKITITKLNGGYIDLIKSASQYLGGI